MFFRSSLWGKVSDGAINKPDGTSGPFWCILAVTNFDEYYEKHKILLLKKVNITKNFY
jgi:hypothetical protein